VRPEMFSGILRRPLGWLALAGVAAGAVLLVTGRWRGREGRAFAGSCALIAGLLAALSVGVFPVMLRSTLAPELSLTAQQAASSPFGLGLALIWWPLAFVLAVVYFAFIARQFRGKVRPAEDNQGYY
jgi:cytochrome bd ubiquinol oxidase subunit II